MQKRLVLVCEDSLCPIKQPDVSGPGLGEAGRYIGGTHGSAGPRVAPLALSFSCVACLSVVCCVRYVLLPHTGLLPAILFKNIWKQNKNYAGLKIRELIFLIELSNMGAHYN